MKPQPQKTMEHAEKKQKNKHKRKQEESEAAAEPEVVLEPKKEKKKKKKQKQEEILSNGLLPNDDQIETVNGSIGEFQKKKKKKSKQSREDSVNNGLLPDSDPKTETFNGSVEESKKKKNKKKNKEEEEGRKESLSNGAAEKCDDRKEFVAKSNETKRIDGSEGVEVSESNGNVVMSGKDANDTKYRPLKSFGDSGLPDNVLECCRDFDKPSPIQSHAWPFLLDGRDFIGIAATGSGNLLNVCAFLCFLSLTVFTFMFCLCDQERLWHLGFQLLCMYWISERVRHLRE